MAKFTHTTTLSALAIVATLSHAHAEPRTLADLDIEVSPELQAMGIDPGVKHMAVNGKWQAVSAGGLVFALAILGQQLQGPAGLTDLVGDSIINDLGSSPGVRNFAVSGATTADILRDQVPKIRADADKVVVEGGINNFSLGSHSSGEIVRDYQQIIAAIERQAPHAKIEVIGILPIDNARGPMTIDGPVTNAQIAAVDAQIAAHCTGRCSVVPSPFGQTLPIAIAPDGVHPRTTAGQAALRRAAH